MDILHIKIVGDLSDPLLTYSKQIQSQQYHDLSNRLISIVSQLAKDLPEQNKEFDVTVRSDGVYVVAKLDDGKVDVNLNKLPKFKEQAEKLIDFVKSQKIFEANDVSPLETFPHVFTHFQYSSQPIQKESQSIVVQMHRFFKRFLGYQITLAPTIKSYIQDQLKGKSADGLKQLYIDNQVWFKELKNRILAKDQNIAKFYTNEELDFIINEQFIKDAKRCLLKIKNLPWDADELYQLDLLRHLHDLQAHPNSAVSLNILKDTEPLKIPFDELSKIPLTEENRDSIISLWQRSLSKLLSKGSQNLKDKTNTNDRIIQTTYARKYLEAWHHIPAIIKTEFPSLSDPKESLAIKEEFYNQHIHPHIKDFIKKRVTDTLDASHLINYLSLEKESIKKLGIRIHNIRFDLSKDERKLFPKEVIKELFFEEIERIAVMDYHLLPSQIDNLREVRQNSSEVKNSADLLFTDQILKTEVSSLAEHSIFSQKQQLNLMFITKMLSRPKEQPLTEGETTKLYEVFEQVRNDVDLKKKVPLILEDRIAYEEVLSFLPNFLKGIVGHFDKNFILQKANFKIPAGISKKALKRVNQYAHNLATYHKYQKEVHEINDKIEKLLDKLNTDPSKILPKERLTLRQVGILSRFERFEKFFLKTGHLKLEEKSDDLKKLSDLMKRSKENWKKMEAILRPAIDLHYPDGSLLAYVGKKKSEFLGKPPTFEEQITMFAANGFTHGGKLVHNEKGQLQLSHIVGYREMEIPSIYQMCISDIWEIDITPLVHPSMHSYLNVLYGNDWQKVINSRYQEIEKELHNQGEKKFKGFSNLILRRLSAGFANQPFFYNLFGYKKVGEMRGHEREYPRNFDRVYAKYFDKGTAPTENQMCSEFASKSTLVAMMKLNKELTKAIQENTYQMFSARKILENLEKDYIPSSSVRNYLLGKRYIGKDFKKTEMAEKELIKILKEQKYKNHEIDLIIRLGNEEIFDLPYSKKERLKAIHPGRMVQLLTDKKCAKRLAPPKEMHAIIAID